MHPSGVGKAQFIQCPEIMWLIGELALSPQHDRRKATLARCEVDFRELDQLLDERTFLMGETPSPPQKSMSSECELV
jgi:hypothetical protein